jgi:S-adenosylmethionine/arginine decarboxylase-like enzyme
MGGSIGIEKKMMEPKSRLLIADISLHEKPTSQMVASIEDVIRREFTVVKDCEYEYTPHGITKVLVLSESHCVIHTYPEYAYLSLDLFVCNAEINLEEVLQHVLAPLSVKDVRSTVLDRRIPVGNAESLLSQ